MSFVLFSAVYIKEYAKGLVLLLAPIGVSYAMYNSYVEKINPSNIVVVQPNIDPYSEKFSGLSDQEQLQRMINQLQF